MSWAASKAVALFIYYPLYVWSYLMFDSPKTVPHYRWIPARGCTLAPVQAQSRPLTPHRLVPKNAHLWSSTLCLQITSGNSDGALIPHKTNNRGHPVVFFASNHRRRILLL